MTNNTIGSAFDQKTEIKITLDKEYVINPVTVSEFYSTAENKIKQKKIQEATMIANTLESNEKMVFLQSVWKDLPSGDELEELVSKFIQTVEGVQSLFLVALKKVNPIMDLEFVKSFINLDTLTDYLIPFYQLIGITQEEPEKPKKGRPRKN